MRAPASINREDCVYAADISRERRYRHALPARVGINAGSA
jgi:putative transposase